MKVQWNRKALKIIGAVLVLLIGATAVYAAIKNYQRQQQLAKVQEMQKQLADRNVPADQRRERFREFRQELEKLSDKDRRSLWQEREKQRRQDMKKYFAMSPKDKKAYLDKQIDRMQARQRQAQQNRPPNGAQANAGRGPNGPGNWRSRSPQEREQARRDRLDSTTPEDRAMMSAFRHDLQARMQARGLPTSGWRGPGGGR